MPTTDIAMLRRMREENEDTPHKLNISDMFSYSPVTKSKDKIRAVKKQQKQNKMSDEANFRGNDSDRGNLFPISLGLKGYVSILP